MSAQRYCLNDGDGDTGNVMLDILVTVVAVSDTKYNRLSTKLAIARI